MPSSRPLVLALALAAAGLAAPGGAQPDGRTILVEPGNPGAFQSIQAAVDASEPGDTVLIAPGIYEEEVWVATPGITIRGMDRQGVVLEGRANHPSCGEGLGVGIWVWRADGVTVDNLTVQNYRRYGVFWDTVQGFFGYRITAGDNCVYGLLTHDSEVGEIAFSEAFGSGDSGLYTGEAADCRCVLHHNDVHDNVIGYSGTKGNHVVIRDNWFHDNGVGILPNTLTPDARHWVFDHLLPSLTDEELDPMGRDSPLQCCVTVSGNLVERNNNRDVTPHGFTEDVRVPFGTGIELAGASGNIVAGNVIRGHARWGLAIHWLVAAPNGNVVHDNVFADNAKFDVWWDEWGVGNCFEGNALRASDPSPLPACGPLPSVGVPSARKDLELALLALGHHVGMGEE